MVKKVLVFNVGSSTIKVSLFRDSKKVFFKKYENLKTNKDYKNSFDSIFRIIKPNDFDIIAHRVVHGGDINKTVKINRKIKKRINKFSKFAPLHNPQELEIINLAEKFHKPQYAVFDTSFFTSLPKISTTYPIPKELTEKYQIKRYGFHGLSHKAVSSNLKGKTITCHLGAGCSMSAIKDGKPIDTSMGLTPLEGLMMMTRSGSVDPGLILFLQHQGHNLDKILNFESGFKGLCNLEDFKDVLKNLKHPRVKLAYDIFIYQIVKYIGAYAAELEGLNNLVFTGAIGEGSWKLREDVCKHFYFLDLKIDHNKNINNQEIISSSGSKINVLVRQANEDEIIVKEVLKIVK